MVKKKIDEQAAAPVQKQQQKASNKSREERETEEHPGQAYQPPGNFKLLDEMQPFFTEASMPNKELWLLRIPLYELDMKDLSNKQWKLRLNASDGNIGHFEDSNGNRYNVVRHDIKGSRKYAYIPTGDTIAVRQVPVEVSIVRSLERTEAPADGGAGDGINNAEEALARELRAPSISQEQEKSGVTKESSKRSSKEHHRGSGKKHKRESSREDGGCVSEGETVEQKQHHKKKSKSQE